MKTALITGATHGIGENMAIELAKEGYSVHIIGRNKERGQKVIDELNKINSNANHKLFIVDLSLIEENKKFLKDYKENYDTLNLLILNANIRPKKNVTLTKEGYNDVFVTGYISRHLFSLELDSLLNKSKDSRIVSIGDARLLQKVDFDKFMNDGVSGMKSLLMAYTASAYLSYFLPKKEFIKTSSEFINPGMVNTDIDKKNSFWINLISKKPNIISKQIVKHILSTSSEEINMKFYNVDKLSNLDKKIDKKYSEFEKLLASFNSEI